MTWIKGSSPGVLRGRAKVRIGKKWQLRNLTTPYGFTARSRKELSEEKGHMGLIRQRVVHTNSLEERLVERARELRKQAAALAPGIEKEALLKLAQQSEAGASMTEWLRAPALQPST
ncbi:hypothetical protein BraRD5C2_35960 [Bradyrhizobium sp. RD5-C2]|nr:hypothetical protein BraRD5C2_35960 [Bradyrhizobium sp. RD5-C2]